MPDSAAVAPPAPISPSSPPSNADPSPRVDVHALVKREVDRRLGAMVQEAVASEEEKRFRQMKWIVAFIGLVGIGTFGTIGTYFIEKAVDARAGSIREYLDLARINSLALKLTLSESFSREDANEVMSLLRRIKRNGNDKATGDVRVVLSDVLRAFVGAGASAEVDELVKIYRRDVLAQPLATEILLHHYGQELVSRAAEPSNDFALKTFEALERVAPGHTLGELALSYRTVFEVKVAMEHPSPKIEGLVARSLGFSQEDSERYIREILIRTRAANWQKGPTPEGAAFAEQARALLARYADALGRIYRVEPETFTEWARDGITEEQSWDAAKSLVTRARDGKRVAAH